MKNSPEHYYEIVFENDDIRNQLTVSGVILEGNTITGSYPKKGNTINVVYLTIGDSDIVSAALVSPINE